MIPIAGILMWIYVIAGTPEKAEISGFNGEGAVNHIVILKHINAKPFNRQTQVLRAAHIPSRKDMKLQPDAMSFNGATWLQKADCLGLRGKGSGFTV